MLSLVVPRDVSGKLFDGLQEHWFDYRFSIKLYVCDQYELIIKEEDPVILASIKYYVLGYLHAAASATYQPSIKTPIQKV